MTPLKISIITIVFNGIPFIEKTIKSVLAQTYQNIEYIVIDGASTDGTQNLIEQFIKDGAEIIYRSDPDKGISDAFNKGISLATGEYLLFLNSDDALAHIEVIQEVTAAIACNHFPIFLYGDCDILDRQTSKVLYRDIVTNFPQSVLKGAILPHPSLFTSKKYFDQYGVFDLNYKIAMDFEWMIRGGPEEKIVHVPLLVSSVRNGGLSGRVGQRKVADEIIAALKKNGLIENYSMELRIWSYFALRRFAKWILSELGLYGVLVNYRDCKKSDLVKRDG
jgi:glycosyltransferase involved in cell wall biosynthesis